MKALPATSRPNRAKLVVARRPDRDAGLGKQFSHGLREFSTGPWPTSLDERYATVLFITASKINELPALSF
jgi:hypothetical protein